MKVFYSRESFRMKVVKEFFLIGCNFDKLNIFKWFCFELSKWTNRGCSFESYDQSECSSLTKRPFKVWILNSSEFCFEDLQPETLILKILRRKCTLCVRKFISANLDILLSNAKSIFITLYMCLNRFGKQSYQDAWKKFAWSI